jgi:hypothetical protein
MDNIKVVKGPIIGIDEKVWRMVNEESSDVGEGKGS